MTQWICLQEKGPPNDSNPVLAFFTNEFGKSRIIKAAYYRENELELCWEFEPWEGCTEDEQGTLYCQPGWYEENEFDDYHYRVPYEITHWTHLPEPPAL